MVFCFFFEIGSNTNSFLSYVSFSSDSFLQCQNNQNAREEQRDEAEGLEEQLREQKETVRDLKEQLTLAKMNLKDAEIKYASQVHQKKKKKKSCVSLM